MALYSKYRPKDFSSMVGNGTVTRAVDKLLKKGKDIPHSWMFTGHSGIGKTTIARIIAQKLGASGSGIVEMNAASVRGIDGVRELISNIQYRQPGSPVSVIILDEAHQLTKDAQNALLKVLEDPPAHAYFIICTTDPTKIIDTIRTRCEEFKFAPLSVDELMEVILVVSSEEKMELSDEILASIAQNAGGSPRLAINMLERCSACTSTQEALSLISGMGLDFQVEGEFEVSGKILDVLLKQKNEKIAWPIIARILDQDIFAVHNDVAGVKTGLTNRMGRYLLKSYHPGMADAIILLEMNKDLYTNASFSGLMLKVVTLVCANGNRGAQNSDGPI